jgi:hypothetical protein
MTRTKRPDPYKWLAVALMTALGAIVFAALVQRPQSDIAIHTLWAEQASLSDLKSFVRQAAHPLWRICVFILMQTGLSAQASAVIFTALCKGLETWALVALAQRLIGHGGWEAALCGVCASMAASVWVPWVNLSVFLSGGSPNPWHSPTQVALMAPMILSVLYTAEAEERFLRTREAVPWRDAAILSVLLLLTALIKPTFLQAFLPAAGVYFLTRWMWSPKGNRHFLRLLLAAAPAVLLIALQFLFYFGGIVETQGGIILLFNGRKTLGVLRLVLLTQLFPLFALAAFADKAAFKKPLFALALLLDAVAVLQMLILSETGYRAQDGNFGWAVMGAALMLWAVALPLYGYQALQWFRRVRKAANGAPHVVNRPRAEAAKLIIGGVLLLWHLGSGIGYYIYLLATQNVL